MSDADVTVNDSAETSVLPRAGEGSLLRCAATGSGSGLGECSFQGLLALGQNLDATPLNLPSNFPRFLFSQETTSHSDWTTIVKLSGATHPANFVPLPTRIYRPWFRRSEFDIVLLSPGSVHVVEVKNVRALRRPSSRGARRPSGLVARTPVLHQALEDVSELRDWLHLTQDEVAELVGIAPRTLYYWQARPETDPHGSKLRRLHEVHALIDGLQKAIGRDGAATWLNEPSETGGSRLAALFGGDIAGVMREARTMLFIAAPRASDHPGEEVDDQAPALLVKPAPEKFAAPPRRKRRR